MNLQDVKEKVKQQQERITKYANDLSGEYGSHTRQSNPRGIRQLLYAPSMNIYINCCYIQIYKSILPTRILL